MSTDPSTHLASFRPRVQVFPTELVDLARHLLLDGLGWRTSLVGGSARSTDVDHDWGATLRMDMVADWVEDFERETNQHTTCVSRISHVSGSTLSISRWKKMA